MTGNSIVPVIETERLILRGHKPDDFPAFAAIRADPLVARFTTGKPIKEEEAWSKFLTCLGLWLNLGYGYWAIEEKASGEFIGEAGFGDFKRDITPSIKGIPEIGWLLGSPFHGRGLGGEAVAAVVAWGDKTFGGKTTVCIIDPDNPASLRLAEKFGYKEYARTEFKGEKVILFRRQS